MSRSKFDFVQVRCKDSLFEIVKNAFTERLEPLYGDQSSALEKILSRTDRVCKVCHIQDGEEGTRPVGILQFKTALTDEFSKYGSLFAFEIKTLFLLHPTRDAGKGIGYAMLQHALSFATSLRALTAIVTVNQDMHDSLGFFQKNGFHRVDCFVGNAGIRLSAIPERNEVTVQSVGSDAEKAGVKAGWKVTSIDKQKIPSSPSPRSLGFLLSGPVGSTTNVQFTTDQGPKSVSLVRTSSFDSKYIRGKDEYLFMKPIQAPTCHTIPIMRKYFEFMRSRSKYREGRLNRGQFTRIRRGDVVSFFCQSDILRFVVTSVDSYPTFREMLEGGRLLSYLPDAKSLDAGVQTYAAIPNYASGEREVGVLGFTLEFLSPDIYSILKPSSSSQQDDRKSKVLTSPVYSSDHYRTSFVASPSSPEQHKRSRPDFSAHPGFQQTQQAPQSQKSIDSSKRARGH